MFNPITASQINIPAVFMANGLGICLMLSILLIRHQRGYILSYDDKLFFWMCRLCLILCALEGLGFLLDGAAFSGARHIATVCNSALFFLAAGIAHLWVCYVDYRLFADKYRIQHINLLLSIPLILLAILSMANIFIDVFFYIDEQNIYHRTALFFVPWVIVYCYMLYSAILAYYYRKRVHKYLFMPVVMFLTPIFIGSLIQMLYYGISLIWVSVALALTVLYINLQHEENCLDPLTGLYNRNYLIHHLEHLNRRAQKGCHITGILLDINNFKHINDTYGHIIGDRVLRATGSILLHAVDCNASVIRYGGDEFLIFLENATPEDVQHILNNIQQQLENYSTTDSAPLQLSLSSGTAVFNQMDIFQFFQEMDRKMYEQKRTFDLAPDNAAASNKQEFSL